MDSIVTKLSEIEHAAVGIVEGADAQKGQYDEEMKQKRKTFDDKIAQETASKIATIRDDLQKSMDEELSTLKANSQQSIANYEREYEEHHEEYAQQIIKHMTEV